MLEDIAILTGGTLVSEETGTALKDATVEVLGSAEKIIVTKDKTTIIGGKGNAEAIQARIKQIEAESAKTRPAPTTKRSSKSAKQNSAGGVAVIRVGAATEPEMKQKKQMFEDSFNSTRAALEEGIVIGGGCALLRASKSCCAQTVPAKKRSAHRSSSKPAKPPSDRSCPTQGFDSSVHPRRSPRFQRRHTSDSMP